MNSIGMKLAKVVMLAGGAVIGALLARWVDDLLAGQMDAQQKQSEYDRNRYSQGLTANPLVPQGPPQTPFQITQEDEKSQQYE